MQFWRESVGKTKRWYPESFSKFDIGEPTVARFDEPNPSSLGDTKGDTTHFDIIDKWGNMIAGTPVEVGYKALNNSKSWILFI